MGVQLPRTVYPLRENYNTLNERGALYDILQRDYFSGYSTVKNELLTKRERNTKFRYLQDDIFKPVNVSKKNTYWFFGARFENGTTYAD